MPPPKLPPHPKSAPDDYYVENEMCICCGVPHAVAPDLMGWTGEKTSHCIWKKQPETREELDQAIAVLEAQEWGCHKYAGDDPAMLKRNSAGYCDYPLPLQRKLPAVTQFGAGPTHFRLIDKEGGSLARFWKRLSHRKNS